MAHFHRLIFCAVVAFLSWLPSSSFAETETIPATSTGTTVPTVKVYSTYGYTGLDANTACYNYALVSWASQYRPGSFSGIVLPRQVQCTGPNAGVNNAFKHQWACSAETMATKWDVDYPTATCASVYTCPANQGWSVSGSSCVREVCVSPAVRNASGVCEAPTPPPPLVCESPTVNVDGVCVDRLAECLALSNGLNYVKEPLLHYGSVGLTACFSGYVINGSGGASGGGQSEMYGPFKCALSDGQPLATCTVLSKPPEIAVSCGANTFPGTVNGVQVCVPATTTVDAPKTTTATPPLEGASAPAIPGTPDGTTSVTRQTTCTDGDCTTVTTYRDSEGEKIGEITESTTQTDHCEENPTSAGCEEDEPSTWGGSCGAPPACDGDAIQCAIAEQTFNTACALDPPENAFASLFDTDSNPNPSFAGKGPDNGFETIMLSSSDFDQTNVLGSSACIADMTITVSGNSFIVPFSKICAGLNMLGAVLMGISFIVAFRIVGRG